MADLILDHLGKIFTGIFVLLFIAGFLAVKQETEARDRFMLQCLDDRPEYECVAMWRSTRHTSTVVPVVIR